MTREAAVAGQFYPGNKHSLEKELEAMIPAGSEKIDAIGAVVPHAGYMYSGAVAGEVYAKIKPKKTYVIFSPNHSGYGAPFALSAESWKTPLGEVSVDKELIDAVKDRSALVKEDATAHAFEHSIEVQLPFIQRIAPGSSIVPITVQHGSMKQLGEVAGAVSSAIKETGKDAAILASSDMTHYESRKTAEEKDHMAIDRILELDPEGLIQVVETNNISMCGYIPAVLMLMACKDLGAKKAELVKYSDSGYVTGDDYQVVGYAGIVVY